MAVWPMPDLPAGETQVFRDDHCASCLKPLRIESRGLFCDDLCKQVAKTVRYTRNVRRRGTSTEQDVRYAIKIRLAHLQNGGYDDAARRIPESVRAQVKSQAVGLCARCGRPGEEIDHVHGPSSSLNNLQLLCKDCHREKTAEQLVRASDEQRAAVAELYERRVTPTAPLLLADDELKWREVESMLRSARRKRLNEKLAELDIDIHGAGLRWTDVVDMYYETMAPAASPVTEDDDSGYGPDSYFARAMNRDD